MAAQDRGLNKFDRHVARRMKLRREELGLSQAEVSVPLDLTFQSIQKYEAQSCRISAGNLWKVAQKLGVPVGYFYEGL